MTTSRPKRRGKPNRCTFFALCAALPSLTHCVSLADFSPSASNLSPSCEAKAYTVTIPGCNPADFAPGNSCSADCLSGLVYINQLVYQYCGATQDYQLLVAEFRNGDGIELLCPGVAVVTSKPNHSQPVQPTHSSKQPSTRIHGTSVVSGTHTVETSGLIYDTSKSPTPSYPVTNITPLTPEKPSSTHKTTTRTSTHFVTRTTTDTHIRSTITRSSSKTSRPGQILTDTSSSPSAPSPLETTYTSTPGSASESQALTSKCVEYGGDPFSDCSGSSSSGASQLHSPRLLAVWIGTAASLACWYLRNL